MIALLAHDHRQAPAASLEPSRCCIKCHRERPRDQFAPRAKRCRACDTKRRPPTPPK